ncbi:tape measure protein [Sphingobacterium sp. Lzh-3]|uniref:tape measure protein n=1 Tax=Sphingobacterium sp. Lzh-3 TaxID=3382150 RepID=UPI00398C8C09
MADLRYKVVVDDDEAKRKISELLKGSGVSSPLSGITDDSKKAATALDEASKANKNLRDAQLANLDALREARIELAKQLKSQADLNNQYTQGKIDLQTFRNEQTKLNAARKEEERQARELKKALSANSEYGKLTAELNRLRNESKNLLAEMFKLERQGYKNSAAYQQLESRSRSLVGQTKILDRQIKTIDTTVGQHYRNVGNYGDAISMVLPQISQFAGRLGLLGAVVAGVKKSFTSNLELEPLKQGINAVSSSSVQAGQTMDFLRKTSDRLGLQFSSTAESFKLWQGAAKFSNITASESKRIFESVATAGAKMKLSNDQVQGTFLALSQMMSKGKVQAEELRGQLAERLPGAFQLAAKAMGVTEQQLNKMLEKGEVVSKDFLPKFATELEKTFGSDKTERVEGMQASINRLSNEFEKLWQSDRAQRFFTTVTDGLADLTSTIGKLVKSDSWKEFFLRLGGSLSGGVGGQIMDIGATGLNSVSNKDDLQRKTFFESFAALTRKEQLEEIARQEKLIADREKYNKALVEPSLRANLEKMKSLVNPEVKPENKLVDQKAIDKTKKDAERAAERSRQAFERQRALQIEIDKINDNASKRNLTRDQQEILSIKEKYARIREEVRKFNSDPKNKGLKVDTSGLPASEKREINDTIYKQQTANILKAYQEDYQNFIKYEDLKKQYGAKVADEQLGQYKSTFEKISGEYAGLRAKQSMAGLNGLERQRMQELEKMLLAHGKKMNEDRVAQLLEAINAAKFLSDKLIDIEKDYQDKVKALKDAGQLTQEKDMQLRREMTQKYANEIDSSPEFQKAMNNIDESLGSMIGAAYRHGKDVVFSLIDGIKGATSEQKAELRKTFGKFFDDGAMQADLGNLQNISQAAQGFADLAKSATEFAFGLADGMETLQKMVSTAGQLASTLASLKGDANGKKAMQDISSYFGIFGAAVSVFQGISQSMKEAQQASFKRMREQIDYQNERQLKSTEAITKMLERQLELMDKIYGAERLEKYGQTLKEIEDNYKDLNKQLDGRYLMTGDKVLDEVLTRLNNGESAKDISKQLSREDAVKWAQALKVLEHLDKFAKSSSIADLATDMNKAKEELAKLQYQADLGNVDDYTGKLIEQLQNQIDLYTETLNKLKEETTGNSFSSILSNLSDLFFNSGLDSADAWSKGFDSVMKNYAIQKFSREYLEKAAQDWYDLFDELAEGGITDTERDSLKKAWDKIQQDGQKRVDELGKIIGSDNSSGLSSSIKREVTEQTQSENNGLLRSQTELLKRTFDESKNQGVTAGKHLQVAIDSLTALNSIQTNTANTVTELKNAVGELQSINKNIGGRY